MKLSTYLSKRSNEICRDNSYTEDQHNCESYAYITAGMSLLDICASDFFQGSSRPHAAVSLPFHSSEEELEQEVADQVADFEA